MSPAQFTRALSGTRMPPDSATARAARLVLVEGLSRGEAARRTGIDQAAISRAVQRLQPSHACPQCQGTGRVTA
jgi:predicted DNA-binding protein (UPF0251 family)